MAAFLEATFAVEVIAIFALSYSGTVRRIFDDENGSIDVACMVAGVFLMGMCAAGIRYICTRLTQWIAPERMRKLKTRIKLGDQAWQLCMHATLGALELRALGIRWYSLSDWQQPVEYVWEHPYNPIDDSTRYAYQLHVVVWTFSGISHCMFEERRKDYKQMLLHHCVTLALVVGSYYAQTTRIGLLIMAIHDVSDIPLDVLKCANYLKLEGANSLFLVETSFVTTLVTWAVLRLYVFPAHVVWTLGWQGSALHVLPARPERYESYIVLNLLLSILACLHVWWYALMCRILIRLLRSETPNDAGGKEYEGDEDD